MDLSAHTSTAQYIFPILRLDNILNCLSELDIKVTKADLVEPKSQKIKDVFLQLLEVCCGTVKEEIDQKSEDLQEAINACAYAHVHENFSDLKFFVALRKFMQICGIYDFGWRDLLTPTAKRLRCQLSGAINMAKYREDELKVYAELNEPRTELLLALEEINEENKELNALLETAQKESDEKYKVMSQVEQECEELELEIARSNKLQASKREEATELKKKHNELKDQLATTKLYLQEKQAEFESLQAKVVTSPDRRKQEIKDLHESVEQERAETKLLEESACKCKKEVMHLQKAMRHTSETADQIEEVLSLLKKSLVVQEELKCTRTNAEALKDKTESLLEKLNESERTMVRKDEKLLHSRKQSKLKMDAAQEAIDAAKVQLLEVEREHLDGVARVESGEAEVKTMETQIEEERMKTKKEITRMIEGFKTVEYRFRERNQALLAAIQAA